MARPTHFPIDFIYPFEGRHKCPSCYFVNPRGAIKGEYKTYLSAYQHFTRYHPMNKINYKCRCCEFAAKGMKELKLHVSKQHPRVKVDDNGVLVGRLPTGASGRNRESLSLTGPGDCAAATLVTDESTLSPASRSRTTTTAASTRARSLRTLRAAQPPPTSGITESSNNRRASSRIITTTRSTTTKRRADSNNNASTSVRNSIISSTLRESMLHNSKSMTSEHEPGERTRLDNDTAGDTSLSTIGLDPGDKTPTNTSGQTRNESLPQELVDAIEHSRYSIDGSTATISPDVQVATSMCVTMTTETVTHASLSRPITSPAIYAGDNSKMDHEQGNRDEPTDIHRTLPTQTSDVEAVPIEGHQAANTANDRFPMPISPIVNIVEYIEPTPEATAVSTDALVESIPPEEPWTLVQQRPRRGRQKGGLPGSECEIGIARPGNNIRGKSTRTRARRNIGCSPPTTISSPSQFARTHHSGEFVGRSPGPPARNNTPTTNPNNSRGNKTNNHNYKSRRKRHGAGTAAARGGSAATPGDCQNIHRRKNNLVDKAKSVANLSDLNTLAVDLASLFTGAVSNKSRKNQYNDLTRPNRIRGKLNTQRNNNDDRELHPNSRRVFNATRIQRLYREKKT
uniref:ZNF462 protein n=1 Tax=Fopius arisanus TaxID=64838 RepID=A0A0C9Q7A8_9HYME